MEHNDETAHDADLKRKKAYMQAQRDRLNWSMQIYEEELLFKYKVIRSTKIIYDKSNMII